ncbi:MAG TPA: amidohydrolase family protein [Candidatus Syntrophosphaera sp.]|nr:amidohydrolase family protein [Candidatus Syntrophosphaera sp.]
MPRIRTNILNPLDRDRLQLAKDQILTWSDGVITGIRPFDPARDSDCEDRRDCLALPGLIDLHVHLSQYRIRGRYEPELLAWLRKHVFPAEALSRDPDYARELAHEFFYALFAAGTTTAVIYTAPYETACEIAFEAAAELGARALIGMTLMDANSPAELQQSTDYAYSRSVELWQRWHQPDGLLDYVFTPRFALSCSETLMRRIGVFASEHRAWIQTHLSENPEEIRQVHKRFGQASYTQVYADMGLLTPHSIFAHAIHLSEREIELLAAHGCKVAHCPDSNFFLKSGEFDYPALERQGVPIGIGSDVAAGSSLNMLYHAKLANYRQSVYPLAPERLLYHVTLGNAAILGLADRIGSLQAGKQADICLLRLPEQPLPDADLPSALCFYGHEFSVAATFISGRKVYGGEKA